eukprot:4966572-Prorocentrum_lima.AAC.1
MTSSLVGSEMCIRDSLYSADVRGEQLLVTDGLSTFAAKLEGAGGRAAVSYTHLTLPTICSV